MRIGHFEQRLDEPRHDRAIAQFFPPLHHVERMREDRMAETMREILPVDGVTLENFDGPGSSHPPLHDRVAMLGGDPGDP